MIQVQPETEDYESAVTFNYCYVEDSAEPKTNCTNGADAHRSSKYLHSHANLLSVLWTCSSG